METFQRCDANKNSITQEICDNLSRNCYNLSCEHIVDVLTSDGMIEMGIHITDNKCNVLDIPF